MGDLISTRLKKNEAKKVRRPWEPGRSGRPPKQRPPEVIVEPVSKVEAFKEELIDERYKYDPRTATRRRGKLPPKQKESPGPERPVDGSMSKKYLQAWDKLSSTDQMLSICKADPWLFAINAIETFDEQEKKWSKFPQFDYLADVFTKIETDGDKYWLKSQRMLITISFCVFFLHSFLYGSGFNGFMTSKVEGAIDNIKAGWNSLFGKVRAMYDRLPDVLVEDALKPHPTSI